MSFQQALSGLNGMSKSLEVIGNNIANSGTYGYKMSRTEFADMYAASLNGATSGATGIGVNVASVSQQFTQGNVSVTENPMDLAVNGDGFFQVGDGNGPPKYTRNGQFKVVQGLGDDSDKRFISDNNGNYLLGIPAGQATPGRLSLPTGRIEAQRTGLIALELNLNADAVEPGPDVETVADLNRADVLATVNNTTSQTVYDGKGQEVEVSYYFRKLAADPAPGAVPRDSWAVYITANGKAVPDQTPDPANGVFLQPAFIARFDPENGGSPDFLDPADLSSSALAPAALDIPATITTNGGTSQAIAGVTLKLDGITQFNAEFGVTKLTQDGFKSGELSDFSIEPGGTITARYTNGQSKPAGQVQLVRFINPQGLEPIGGNLWKSTVDSGQPTANNPGAGGTGILLQGQLEESNVDLTAELVNMITAQRMYQANAQTIKTMDQVLQTVVNLR
jgi:flagellar hook protein FlgE